MRAEPAMLSKPRLRGASHHAAFYAALGAGPMLVATTRPASAWATAIYALCLVALFGVSALYHRPDWAPGPRRWLRRLDHAAIYLMIAGSYTPIFYFGLGAEAGLRLLPWVWLAAAAGVVKTLFWVHAPKPLNVALYLVFGGLGAWRLPEVAARSGPEAMWLLATGGLIYACGAVVYALRRPDPAPQTFGYHEIFHACVIVAALCHFLAILELVRQFS